MASRVLLAALLIIVLLIIVLPAGAHADSVRRQLREKKEPSRLNEVLVRRHGASRHGRKLGESKNVIGVGSHGAVGDGQQDDTPAFEKAWIAACSSSQIGRAHV